MQPHHVFVYGSLRPNEAAFGRLLESVTVSVTDATLRDHALFGRTLPYPFVAPRQGARVSGALIELEPAMIDATLRSLDEYEGSSYRRAVVAVETPTGPVDAHVYLAATDVSLDDADLVDSGDWSNR